MGLPHAARNWLLQVKPLDAVKLAPRQAECEAGDAVEVVPRLMLGTSVSDGEKVAMLLGAPCSPAHVAAMLPLGNSTCASSLRFTMGPEAERLPRNASVASSTSSDPEAAALFAAEAAPHAPGARPRPRLGLY